MHADEMPPSSSLVRTGWWWLQVQSEHSQLVRETDELRTLHAQAKVDLLRERGLVQAAQERLQKVSAEHEASAAQVVSIQSELVALQASSAERDEQSGRLAAFLRQKAREGIHTAALQPTTCSVPISVVHV